ncbi:hypothetical protein [Paenibacillus sp. UMB7766-LJ446]|uniref:hypothetical protein n=1 Tax=Paenibacillus sp. UMB7766-LJ446 TaxID=3046313 RepID=UPI003313081C
MKPVKVGIFGGSISRINFANLKNHLEVELVAAADIERAKARAEEYNIEKACTVEQPSRPSWPYSVRSAA